VICKVTLRKSGKCSDIQAAVARQSDERPTTGVEGRLMTRIRCRWHDAGVIGVPPATPGKQAAAAFALYGLRLQAQGISPGPVEATITITDHHGYFFGQLDLDAGDAAFMVAAISGALNLEYGPWKSEDADRLLADY
jgi:hypothetical protein